MRAHLVVTAALAIVCLTLPVRARAQSSAAIPAVTGTVGHADFLDEGRLGHDVFGGGLEWVLTRHIAVGPEILYMRGPGDDRDMFLVGVARFGILPLRSAGSAVRHGRRRRDDPQQPLRRDVVQLDRGRLHPGRRRAHQCHRARVHRAGIHDGLGAAHAVLGHRRRPVSAGRRAQTCSCQPFDPTQCSGVRH